MTKELNELILELEHHYMPTAKTLYFVKEGDKLVPINIWVKRKRIQTECIERCFSLAPVRRYIIPRDMLPLTIVAKRITSTQKKERYFRFEKPERKYINVLLNEGVI